MLSIQTYQANGERIEHAGQRPAFYSLAFNGVIIGYYTTFEALKLTRESIELNENAERGTDLIEFDNAA